MNNAGALRIKLHTLGNCMELQVYSHYIYGMIKNSKDISSNFCFKHHWNIILVLNYCYDIESCNKILIPAEDWPDIKISMKFLPRGPLASRSGRTRR